ncbi:MAG TPA: CoA-binding protein [Chloroflexota bacterium]|nr:CoA-binding protein [Chloroflexota bacterium]
MSTDIPALLRATKTIAVVGLSSNPTRASHGVSRYMQRQGYRIIPVNPQETEVLGEKAYARLEDVPEPVDMVNIFRLPQYVPPIVDSAIAIGAKSIWMQLGIRHDEAAAKAENAGLEVVMDKCLMVERMGIDY